MLKEQALLMSLFWAGLGYSLFVSIPIKSDKNEKKTSKLLIWKHKG